MNDFDTLSSMAVFSDAAKIVNSVTTPTPTMSAAAVPEVRRGLRIAFWRASDPVTPRSHRSGVPMMPLAGRATTGPNTTTPTIVSSAPSPARASTESPPLSTAVMTTATPMAVSATPVIARRAEAVVRSTDTSRMAASGATREALTAGATPATRVTTTPTIMEITTTEALNTRPPAGKEKPTASKSTLSRLAMPTPPSTPTADATKPTSKASKTTEARI